MKIFYHETIGHSLTSVIETKIEVDSGSSIICLSNSAARIRLEVYTSFLALSVYSVFHIATQVQHSVKDILLLLCGIL